MTHDELVEKVGTAVMEDALGDRRGYRQTWEGLDDEIRAEIIEHVGKTAIATVYEAIREPGNHMSVPGGLTIEEAMFEAEDAKRIFDVAADCYRAMIDASGLCPRPAP